MSKKPTRKYPRKQDQKNTKWLPILVTLGGFLLLLLGFLALRNQSSDRVAPEVTGSPSLKVDKEEVDFGDVKLNQPIQVSFTLTNVGDQPLRIDEKPYIEVVEGCWPPIPTIGSMVLEPDESTNLSMQFMMHAGMEGKHNFQVHISSNDPRSPDRTLTVLSNWVPWSKPEMSEPYPFLILERPGYEAVNWVTSKVSAAGLQIIRTFDSNDAVIGPLDCLCPDHGSDRCDCQVVILLVYKDNAQPVSLVVHSHDGRTWFSLVDTPHQRADSGLEQLIHQAIALD